jgi:L-lactate dehydrogenase (cytochrome)
MAGRRLPRPIFDFIDGAAFRERTLAANVEDFGRIRLRQRVLRDVSDIDLGTRVLGQAMTMPVAIAPTGISGILPAGGHGELMAARAARAGGIPFTLGMMATASIEDVANAVAPPWYQLCMLRDRAIVRGMVERAKLAGCPVLVLTTTWPFYSELHRLTRNPHGSIPPKFSLGTIFTFGRKPVWSLRALLQPRLIFRNFAPHMDDPSDIVKIVGQLDASTVWEDVAWLRDLWPGKLIVKGITEADDVEEAVRIGIDAVSVSNHGGNQLDEACSAISCLPAVAEAAWGRLTVLMDGGIRSGQDVLKALALGAGACLLGRVHLYGLAAAGEAGVEKALAIIRRELEVSAGMTGVARITDVSREVVRLDPGWPEHPPAQSARGRTLPDFNTTSA